MDGQEDGESNSRVPRTPPKIEFPDPPNLENVLGGTFPFTRKKKPGSHGGTPTSSSPVRTPRAGAPSKESPRVGTPVQVPQRTDAPSSESSHAATKRVQDSTEPRTASPRKKPYSAQRVPISEQMGFSPKKKEYSGQTPPISQRLGSPSETKQYSAPQRIPISEQMGFSQKKKEYSGKTTTIPEPLGSTSPPEKKQYSAPQKIPISEQMGFPPKKKDNSGQKTPISKPLESQPEKKQYSAPQRIPISEQVGFSPKKNDNLGQKTSIAKAPGAPLVKQQPSGQPTSRDLSPAKTPAEKQSPPLRQHGYPAPSIPFIRAKEPPSGHVYETEMVIPEPPTFSGYRFTSSDVAMAIECAQVQSIISGDSRRQRPPPGVNVRSRSWLLEAVLKAKQQNLQGSEPEHDQIQNPGS